MQNKKGLCGLLLFSAIGVMSLGLANNNGANSVDALFAAATKTIISNGKAYSDFATEEDVWKAGDSLNETIAEEGIVLLKNQDNDLPYDNVKRVSVFGKNSARLIYGGTGSGGGNSDSAATIFDSLEAVGLECNSALRNFYLDDRLSGPQFEGGNFMTFAGSTIGEAPIDLYTPDLDQSTKVYNDAAIIVFSRGGGEGNDLDRVNAVDHRGDESKPGYVQSHYLELSKNEKDMLAYVKERFNRITVVINSAEAMELGCLKDDPAITSMIWVSTPGNSGIMALGRILKGTVNPSGRLVDTYAADFTKDPTWQNFGNNNQSMTPGADGSYPQNYFAKLADGKYVPGIKIGGLLGGLMQSECAPYVQYEEGIYYGANYYETRGHTDGEAWYEANVVYPNGYGLSYTTFSQTIKSTSVTAGSELTKNGKLEFTINVKNTGSVAGKDVVQLYYTAPYDVTSAPIEKPHVTLGAFSKTKLLKPGESQDIKLTIDVQDMASYDYLDMNNNGHVGYELDAGTYTIKLLNNAHDADNPKFASKVFDTVDYVVSSVINYTTDKVTGNEVTNRFTGEDSIYKSTPYADDMKHTELSRSNWVDTFPEAPKMDTAADRVKANSKMAERLKHVFVLDDIEGKTDDPRYKTAADLAGCSQVDENVTNNTHTLMLKDMVNCDYDDPKWNQLLNELKFSEMTELCRTGLYHVGGLESIGKPVAVDSDGPAAINKVRYASEVLIAATYNVELIEKQGQLIGDEALFCGKVGWYGPAMNMHRSPFGGRNFEYFAESPLLSGAMAAAQIRGAQSKGIYAYAKHFAVNDQETSRQGISTYVNEQALREIYLKPFEYAVKEGFSMGIMTSFNKIGNVDAACNYALNTQVLREEWGFQGAVVTDGYSGTGHQAYMNMNAMYISGGDLPLGDEAASEVYGYWSNEKHCVVYKDAQDVEKVSYSFWYAIRRATKGLLYAAAHSSQMRNNLNTQVFTGKTLTAAKGIEFSQDIGATATDVGTKNLTYSVTNGQLPNGLTLSKEGVISGTPTDLGTTRFEITLSADYWVKETKEYTINVTSPFKYEGTDLSAIAINSPVVGQISSEAIAANVNGYKTVTYEVAEGSRLPVGLDLSESGAIEGVALVAGTFTTTIDVTAVKQVNGWFGNVSLIPTTFKVDYTFVIVPKLLTVTFNGNYEGSTPTTASVNGGEAVARPVDAVREGYIFTGWFTDAACTTPVDFSASIEADVTYYAGWTKKVEQVEGQIEKLEKNAAPIVVASVSGVLAIASLASVLVLFLKKKAK